LNTQVIDFGAVVSKKPVGTRFILVRHGETDWNREKRFQGHTDIALNKSGLQQAELVRRHFDLLALAGSTLYQHCFSSDLDRACTTAKIIHGDRQPGIVLNSSLRERDYGHLSGLTADEMQTRSPAEYKGLRERTPNAPLSGGESLGEFYGRVVAAFQHIAMTHQDSTILLVAHGGVLDCIYRFCMGEPLQKPREWLLPNCALNLIELDSRRIWTAPLWAWTGHLNIDRPDQNMDEVDGRIA
jgi:probable phosphoglycerate mutase